MMRNLSGVRGRRPFFTVLLSLSLLACLVAGCGTSGTQAAPGPDDDASGAFPVTIAHGQGKAVIPQRPRRVLTLGWGDAQIASALGAPIVAATRNPAAKDGNWPGMREKLPPEVAGLDSAKPNLEAIAAARPDLILMTTAQPTFIAEYDKLSAIAPVVSYQSEHLKDDGEKLTLMIGKALGKQAEAQALIQRSRQAITAFTRELPAIKGKKILFGQYYEGTTGVLVDPQSQSVRFLKSLGLTIPEQVTAHGGPVRLGSLQLASENLDLLDSADVVLIHSAPGDEAFAALPTVRDLSVVAKKHLHYVGHDFAGMLLTPNPAVTEHLLQAMRPALTALAFE